MQIQGFGPYNSHRKICRNCSEIGIQKGSLCDCTRARVDIRPRASITGAVNNNAINKPVNNHRLSFISAGYPLDSGDPKM